MYVMATVRIDRDNEPANVAVGEAAAVAGRVAIGSASTAGSASRQTVSVHAIGRRTT